MVTKIIFESKVYSLTPSIENQIDTLTNKLIKLMEDVGYVKLKAFLMKQPNQEYQVFTFHDRVPQNPEMEVILPVYLKTKKRERESAVFEGEYNSMYLYLNTVADVSSEYMRSVIVHEFVHAVQKYQDVSEKYKKAVNTKKYGKEYFTAPVEYEAYTAQVMSIIKRYFYALSPTPFQHNAYGTTRLISNRQLFLTQLYYALLKYHSDTLIPAPLISFKEMFHFWKEKPRLWKKFKRKLKETMDELYKNIQSPKTNYAIAPFVPHYLILNTVNMPYGYE